MHGIYGRQCGAYMPSQVLDHVVDALGEGHDISRFHRGEHANAQLVAAQLAVAGGVHNAVLAQDGQYLRGLDSLVQINGDHGVRACVRIDDERSGVFGALGPRVQDGCGLGATRGGPGEAAVAVEPANLVFHHDQGGHGGRIQGLILAGVVQCRGQREERRHPAMCAFQMSA